MWTPERTWLPGDMESAGRMNTMVRDNLKALRFRPAFRDHSSTNQEADAVATLQRMIVDLIKDPATTADYDRELVTQADGYYDAVGGTYNTARRGIYEFGAQATATLPTNSDYTTFTMLELLVVNDVTGRVVGGRTAVADSTRPSTTLTCLVPAKADDAFRVDFAIFTGDPTAELHSESFFSAVAWGHWVKDWPFTAVIG